MKNFSKYVLALTLGIATSGVGHATELVTNGGFETGDFSGWNVVNNGGTGGCGSNVYVVNSTGQEGCGALAAPISGTYAAYNTFDGQAANYVLSQQITLPNVITAATVSFLYEASMAYSGASRSFSVDLYDASGTTLLTSLYTQVFGGGEQDPWTTVTQEVTSALQAYAGNTVDLELINVVPESFTGPANFGLDNVSLDVTGTPVPEPASMAVLFTGLSVLGFARRKRSTV